MVLSPGARLGPNEILAVIGAGGMGEVYKACDTRLDRTVAIKIPPREVSADPDPSAGSGSSRGSTNSPRPELAEGRAKSRDERRAHGRAAECSRPNNSRALAAPFADALAHLEEEELKEA